MLDVPKKESYGNIKTIRTEEGLGHRAVRYSVKKCWVEEGVKNNELKKLEVLNRKQMKLITVI